MRAKRVLGVAAVVGMCATLATSGGATAAPKGLIPNGVTIHSRHYDLYGFVFSPKPAQCARDRWVYAVKQSGKHQDPQDEKIGRDGHVEKVTSGPNKGKYARHTRCA
jgi:hypothetical protein